MSNSTDSAPTVRGQTPLPRQLDRWHSILAELADPDVELDVETVAPLVATFQALRRAGHPFDPAMIVLMDKLRVQLSDGTREGCVEDHEPGLDADDEEGFDLCAAGSRGANEASADIHFVDAGIRFAAKKRAEVRARKNRTIPNAEKLAQLARRVGHLVPLAPVFLSGRVRP